MKGRDMFCASQASTAICLSNIIVDQPSSSCCSSNPGSTPFIDRHNPIIRDERRNIPLTPPCSFQTSVSPKSQKLHSRSYNSSIKDRDYLVLNQKPKKQTEQKKKQSSFGKETENISVKKSSVIKAGVLATPHGSTRYLLGDSGFYKTSSGYDPVEPMKNNDPIESKSQFVKTDVSSSSLKSSVKPVSTRSPVSSDQVVVLRVSLHCKGCEGKVRKHISKMAGVKSFNIDFPGKKVTVVGDVTPLSVLASISKVKNAQLLNPLSATPCHVPGNK